jgi:hypothetical protein
MKTRTSFVLILLAGMLLFTACTGSVSTGSTSTPDPSLMSINERTIWDFENLRNEVHDLAAAAADTPAEDLDPIVNQVYALSEEIKEYEFPLFAVKAHSALYYFANSTYICYSQKEQEYMGEMAGDEIIGEVNYSHCDQAPIFGESVDLLLQELKETNAEK